MKSAGSNMSRYLTITDQNRLWGFYVTTVGHAHIMPGEIYPKNIDHPGSHSFTWNTGRILDAYYLVFITKGSGVFESSITNPVKISAGSCFFLFPGVWHRYKPDAISGWDEYWVGFKGEYADSLVSNQFFKPEAPFIHLTQSDRFHQLFQHLISTVRSSGVNYQPVISGITMQLLGIFNTIASGNMLAADPDMTLVEKAKFLMRENMEIQLSMEMVAGELPMGYSAFRKLFKKLTGTSPNQYYLDVRFKSAIELMQTTHLNFKEIAHKTGFESEFYFSKIFKKKFGLAPQKIQKAFVVPSNKTPVIFELKTS